MRFLAAATRALLRRLVQWWSKQGQHFPPFPDQAHHDAQCLQDIAEACAPAAVPTLAIHLCSPTAEVAEAAAEAIQQIVAQCTPLELAQLDGRIREVGDWRAPRSSPADVMALSHGLVGTLGVLSSHRSGYVREAAIRRLTGVQDGQELPFLLIRVNDWVYEIRKAAKTAVLDRLTSDYAAHFVKNLPLVFNLQQQGREDHQEIVDAVLQLLSRPESQRALRDGLFSTDRATRRVAFRLAVDAAADDERLQRLLLQSIGAADPSLSLWAARMMRTRLVGDLLRQGLERMEKDRFMPVRREALIGMVEKFPDAAPRHLREALLDSHISIRELARFYLRQRQEWDFPGFYRQHLQSAEDRRLAAAISGLGETGAADHAALLLRFLRHASVRVRKAAVRSIGQLDGGAHIDALVAMLSDEKPSVVKAARDSLMPRRHQIDPERLWSLLTTDQRRHVRRAALLLISQLDKWASIPLLLKAHAREDPRLREEAAEYLHQWWCRYNSSFTRPTARQIEEFDNALAESEPSVNPKLIRELRGILDQIKRGMP